MFFLKKYMEKIEIEFTLDSKDEEDSKIISFLNEERQNGKSDEELLILLMKFGVHSRKQAQHNVQDNNGNTALMYAIENGFPDMAKKMLADGANPLVRNNEGVTPIMLASKQGYSELIDMMMTKVILTPNFIHSEINE